MFVILGTSSVGLVLRFRPQSSETGTHSGVDADTVENKQMISWSKIHQMNYKDTSFLVVRLDKSEMKFTVKSNEECRYLWVRSIGNHQVCQYAYKFSCLIGNGWATICKKRYFRAGHYLYHGTDTAYENPFI